MGTDDTYITALNVLRKYDLFGNTSARLLADLVDLATSSVRPIPFGEVQRLDPSVFVAVLNGAAIRVAGSADSSCPRDPQERSSWNAGSIIETCGKGEISLSGCAPIGALVLPFTQKVFEQALAGSPEFARSLNTATVQAPTLRSLIEKHRKKVELIWLCEAPGVGAPMEALAHLLASSAGNLPPPAGGPHAVNAKEHDDTRLDRSALIVTGAGQATLFVWKDESFRPIGAWNQNDGTWTADGRNESETVRCFDSDEVSRRLEGDGPTGAFYRVFFVRDRAPNVLPAALRGLKFHRIVYLARSVPSVIPPDLLRQLDDKLRNEEHPSSPYFSSFIPSIVLEDGPVRPPRSGRPSRTTLLRAVLGQMLGLGKGDGGFRTELIGEDAVVTAKGPMTLPRSRMMRDLCRVSFGLARLQELWNEAAYKPPPAKTTTNGSEKEAGQPNEPDGKHRHHALFVRIALAAEPSYARTAGRWLRAITNRQVGLALSGGGATSYRGVPLLRFLHERGVPIDVIGSSSGGSLLASYFCRDGLAGLHSYIHDGPLASDSGIAAIVNSQVIEEVLDWVFRGTRVEHLGVRFVPVTMALPSGGAPEARAVTSGTLGEAVRVSGAFPLFLAPTTKKGMIYADGSLATLVPARALPSFGADLVFAFSSVPGPIDSNPWADLPGIGLLFKYTPLGRLVDLLASNGYLLEQVTQAVGGDATVYIQSSPSNLSLLEILRFGHAQRIITESERDPRVRAGAAACATAWNLFTQRQAQAPQPDSHGFH